MTLTVGDCRDILRGLETASVDACVTDPPYLLGFMNKGWDRPEANPAADVDLWREVLRVLKPGAHLLAFGAPRTYHRVACAIEDAGFEVRDSIHWVFGQGFPKSLDVSKAIDKAAGAEREVVGSRKLTGNAAMTTAEKGGTYASNTDSRGVAPIEVPITAPATDAARQWEGWGTALKPAHEPIILARKPLAGTVADNVQAHGTGAINVDGCRVGVSKQVPGSLSRSPNRVYSGAWGFEDGTESGHNPNIGRWPPNLLLTHSPDCIDDTCADGCPVREMGEQSGERPSAGNKRPTKGSGALFGSTAEREWSVAEVSKGDTGTAARYFPCFRYAPKASKRDRGEGNDHPTVKPVALMRWLVRLVTPPGGLVLDPFAGSGTTGVACAQEDFRFLGLELSEHYADIARRRIEAAT